MNDIRLQPHILMYEPNEEIVIFEGDFQLKNDTTIINISSSRIYITWNNKLRIAFTGYSERIIHELDTYWQVLINGDISGEAHITSTTNNYCIGSILNFEVGQQGEDLDYVKFAIVNLDKFFGDPTRDGKQAHRDRLTFDNGEYEITIENRKDIETIISKLAESGGGSCITHYGLIRKHNSQLKMKDATQIAAVFSAFISFMFGHRLEATLFHGYKNDINVNKRYLERYILGYKYYGSWLPYFKNEGTKELWCSFFRTWIENEDQKDVLNSAIHWYNESNFRTASMKGSYIMAFAGLELMYNVMIGKRVDANKKIDSLTKLLNISDINAAELCDMRNWLVHYGKENRARYSQLTFNQKYEYLEKIILLLELSILKYLDYQGCYQDRTDGKIWQGESCYLVPWLNQ